MDLGRSLGGTRQAEMERSGTEPAQASSAPDAASAGIMGDERRMQVRAYNFWAGLLDGGKFPAIDRLDPAQLEDFGPFSVVLDLTSGIETPGIRFLGTKLAEECDVSTEITRLQDVPPRSLLSRLTDHYMQILANEAPIGFEAEFVNQREETILYRGILLPLSSDEEAIDHIHGVINWKVQEVQPERTNWAEAVDETIAAPKPSRQPLLTVEEEDDEPVEALPLTSEPLADPAPTADAAPLPQPSFGVAATPAAQSSHDGSPTSPALVETAPEGLYDLLANARELASEARSLEDRSHRSLYEALGRAYDFALEARQAPEEFAEILHDCGLSQQERAPMTPIAKLVFGMDYDKQRISTYATALAHADRLSLLRGSFTSFLQEFDGGLKALVAAERTARRGAGSPVEALRGLSKAVLRKLNMIAPRQLEGLPSEGEEFALVMVRRSTNGKIVVLDEVPKDQRLLAEAARKLVKAREEQDDSESLRPAA